MLREESRTGLIERCPLRGGTFMAFSLTLRATRTAHSLEFRLQAVGKAKFRLMKAEL